jgi:hypothetical protein
MAKIRAPYRPPPQYDIDALLDAGLSQPDAAFSVVDSLWTAIEGVPKSLEHDYFRPDSMLLEPEIAVADICRFSTTMGNGFSVNLGYPGGILRFSRALRSLRLVGHPKALTIMETVLQRLQELGFRAFTNFPDDPVYGWSSEWPEGSGALDWESEHRLEVETGPGGLDLDSQWWELDRSGLGKCAPFLPDDPSLHCGICRYLDAQRELLRCRKRFTR